MALYQNSVAGANANANLYSLVEAVKANEPHAYVKQVLRELPAVQTHWNMCRRYYQLTCSGLNLMLLKSLTVIR